MTEALFEGGSEFGLGKGFFQSQRIIGTDQCYSEASGDETGGVFEGVGAEEEFLDVFVDGGVGADAILVHASDQISFT